MYCKRCHYTSFDHFPTCPRCGYEWNNDREKLNLKWVGYNKATWLKEKNSFPENRSQEPHDSFTLKNDPSVPSPKTSSNKAIQQTPFLQQNTINEISFPELELLKVKEDKKYD